MNIHRIHTFKFERIETFTLFPKPKRTFKTLLWAALWLGPAVANSAENAKAPHVQLVRQQPWSTVFGDREATINFSLVGADAAAGQLYWSLQHDTRRIQSGEAAIPAGAPVEVVLRLPAVKPGVVLPLVLTGSVVLPGEKLPLAKLEENIWVFPDDAFFERKRWLEELKIKLFDPVEKTAERLRSAEVPFEAITNPAALSETQEGIVIIGEGISFREERALPEILVSIASRGVPVLCLQPVDGEIAIPTGSEPGVRKPLRLTFRGEDAIRELDKRLDGAFWGTEPLTVGYRLAVAGGRGGLAAEVSQEDAGWPWLEMVFAEATPKDLAKVSEEGATEFRGRISVVCFPLIARWDDGPTPRFLFAALLEKLSTP